MTAKKIKIKDKDKPVKVVYGDVLLTNICKYCKSIDKPLSFMEMGFIAHIIDEVLTKPYPQLITNKDNQE